MSTFFIIPYMRKVFFPEWDSLGLDFVIKALTDEGFELCRYPIPQSEPDQDKRAALCEDLVAQIISGGYDFVFSVNFLPVVAVACKACRIKYLSWTYDSPCVELYSETVAYEGNYCFVFDGQTVADLRAKGINTVHYLPLAADVTFYDKICANTGNKYTADISFVGSLYNSVKGPFAALENSGPYLRGYLEGLIEAQLRIYGANFLEAALEEGIIEQLQALCRMPQRVHSMESIAWIYANYYLASKVTGCERAEIMRRLYAAGHKPRLYTGEGAHAGLDVPDSGAVDYYSQAPLVFHRSKINLNISVRSILSGIPLRAFDIMGCGGFLVTNYQADFLRHFTPGEDFVYYESMPDLCDKVDYYLEHAEERECIAQSGYEKVKAAHTYHHRIREMLNCL